MENSIRSIMEYLCETLAFEKITFSKCRDNHILRASVTPFARRGEAYIQIETFTDDGKALHRNLTAKEAAEVLCEMAERQYKQTNVRTQNGDCEIRFSKKEQCSILNRIKTAAAPTPRTLTAHNKKKQYLLDPATDDGARAFLFHLGITDEGGRILDKKRPKYRQINRFLELVDDIYGTLPGDGTIVIYDLCCGKSYLTFAVYHYFTAIKGRTVKMHGVDLKPDVIAYCNETASALGMTSLSFSCGDINAYEPPAGEIPDLVLSLHACDIATDIVLKNAVRFGAKAVLSTPCCHHEVFHAMNSEPLAFINRHSMLSQKLADAATDALRCLWLEMHDYDVQTMELIDPEETPKNMMIRALKRKKARSSAEKEALQVQYDAACALIGCVPYLGRKQEI